jgi:hypothetical protein
MTNQTAATTALSEELCCGGRGVVCEAEDMQLHRFEPQELARFQCETRRPRH